MNALMIIDLQNDFCPGGALPAPKANEIVPRINYLMDNFDAVFASRDVHPPSTKHFEKWPPHCVQDTNGAKFHPGLNVLKIQKVFVKGTGIKDDGYSAFEATNENLAEFLKKNDVSSLYLTGLTTEYCVKETALDSVKSGFKTFLIKDAIAAVQPGSDIEKMSISEMEKAGVTLLKTNDYN